MAAVASITIQVDASGALTAINSVTGAVQDLGPAFDAAGSKSSSVLGQMTTDHEQAHDAAVLLGRTLGVELPRQLDTFLAKSQTIGPILAEAFNASIFVAFGAAAIAALSKIPALVDNISESTTHAKEETQLLQQSAQDLGKTYQTQAENLASFQAQLNLIGKSGSDLASAQADNALSKLTAAEGVLSQMQAQQKALQGLAGETATLGVGETGDVGIPTPTAAATQAQLGLDQLQPKIVAQQVAVEKLRDDYVVLADTIKNDVGKEASDAADQQNKLLQSQQAAIEKFIEDRAAADAQLTTDQDEQLVKQAADRQQAIDQMVKDEQDGMDKIWSATVDEANKEDQQRTEDARQQQDAINKQMEQQKQAAEEWTRARDQLANSLDSFFRELSTGDIGKAFLEQFEKLVSQMVATWLLGMGSMQTGTTAALGIGGGVPGIVGGGSGGILGTLFGGLGIGGSGSGVTATPPFVAAPSAIPPSLAASLPMSAGGAISPSTTLPAGASVGSAPGGSSGILSLLASKGPLLELGGAAELANAIGFGGPVSGALSGGLSTALGLSAVSAIAPSLLGSSVGAFFGPLGIGIGAAIGGLIGLFDKGGQATARHNLQMQEFNDIDSVVDQFTYGGLDYTSALNQLESLRTQYTQQFGQIGGGSDFVDPYVNNDIQKLNQLQAERDARQSITFAPAQFARGGLVRFAGVPAPAWFSDGAERFASGGDVVPAMLTPGEFVMNRRAVQREGVSKLQSINSGAGGDVHVHIHTLDTKTIGSWLNNGGLAIFQRAIAVARSEGRA